MPLLIFNSWSQQDPARLRGCTALVPSRIDYMLSQQLEGMPEHTKPPQSKPSNSLPHVSELIGYDKKYFVHASPHVPKYWPVWGVYKHWAVRDAVFLHF